MTELSLSSAKKLPLMEMFGPTIQGEGIMIGVQTYFFRFGLCDYKCKLCDSLHAIDPVLVKKNAEYLTQSEIAEKFFAMHDNVNAATKWITLSGGNPCIHDLGELVRILKEHDFMIAVETQGTFRPYWLDLCDVVTVSPKGQGIGEKIEFDKLDKFVEGFTKTNSEYRLSMKIPVFHQQDLELAAMLRERYPLIRDDRFFLSLGNPYPPDKEGKSPVSHSTLISTLVGAYHRLFEDIKHDPVLCNVRFLPQWHVFVWGNDKGR